MDRPAIDIICQNCCDFSPKIVRTTKTEHGIKGEVGCRCAIICDKLKEYKKEQRNDTRNIC